MLRVIEYFAKSFKVTRGHSKMTPLSMGMRKSLLVFHCNHVCISYTVSEIFIVKRDLEIWVKGHSMFLYKSKAWVRFPISILYQLAYGRIFSRFDTIHERNDSIGRVYA